MVDFDVPCKTQLWLSERAEEATEEFSSCGTPYLQFWKRVKRQCQNGFEVYEGDSIRHEWDGVFRIGFTNSMFRLIGFYDDDGFKTGFIGMDAFIKKGQKLNSSERGRIDNVAHVKKEGLWSKVTDETYPRIVQ